MEMLSRRQAIQSSAIVMGLPLLDTLTAGKLGAQESSASHSKALTVPPLSHDLVIYTQARACEVYAKVMDGTVGQSDLLNMGAQLHQYARHLSETGVDAVIRHVAKQSKAGTLPDFSHHPFIDTTYLTLKQYNPAITRESIARRFTSTPELKVEALTRLATKGLAGIFHDGADSIQNYGKQLPATLSASDRHPQRRAPWAPQSDGSFVTPASYSAAHMPHLVEVSAVGDVCKKIACLSLTNDWAQHTISMLIAAAITYGASVAAAGICTADAAAAILLDISTAGGASIATPLEVALCGAVVGATGLLLQFAEGVGIATVVDETLTAVQQAIGCPAA